MRLLTHNMLTCNVKGVTKGYPLKIEAVRLETKEAEFNPDFLRRIFPKLDWKALYETALSCVPFVPAGAIASVHLTVMVNDLQSSWPATGMPSAVLASELDLDELPEQAEPSMLEDEAFLQKLHHVLLEVTLEEGALVCPETGRRFPVSKGIPNMLLNEDEV